MSNLEITNNDTSGVVLWDPVFQDATLNFSVAETWPAGAVLGKVTSTQKYVRFNPGASDGSEIPLAVLTQPVTAAAVGDVPARPLISGQVRTEKLIDNADASLSASQLDALRDYSIIAQSTTELSELDNQ
jgi:hypothetical protein